MLSIKSILSYILTGIGKKDPRFTVVDDEHVLDNKTGITLHVYDNWFKLSYENKSVATKDDFTESEQGIIWEIKQAITDPVVLRQRQLDYKPLQIARRNRLSNLYEKPTPIVNNTPQEEADAVLYSG